MASFAMAVGSVSALAVAAVVVTALLRSGPADAGPSPAPSVAALPEPATLAERLPASSETPAKPVETAEAPAPTLPEIGPRRLPPQALVAAPLSPPPPEHQVPREGPGGPRPDRNPVASPSEDDRAAIAVSAGPGQRAPAARSAARAERVGARGEAREVGARGEALQAAENETLPRTLSRAEVVAGMAPVAEVVRNCAGGASANASVDFVIEGETGRVRRAVVGGPIAGTTVGACVARAVRRARFPRFTDGTLAVRSFPVELR